MDEAGAVEEDVDGAFVADNPLDRGRIADVEPQGSRLEPSVASAASASSLISVAITDAPSRKRQRGGPADALGGGGDECRLVS